MDEILDEETGGGSGAGRTANPLPGCLRRKGAQPGGSGAGHRGRDTHRRGRSGQGLGGQAWVDGYWEARTVPAVDKIEINRVGEFTTTTLSGEPFTQEDLGHVLLFAFVDPASEDAGAFYDAMTAAWDGVQEAGAGMVLCLKGEDERGQFADAPFPVILYNDSLKEALGNNSGMVEDKDVPNTASWYVNGSFLSAWALVLDAEELPEEQQHCP